MNVLITGSEGMVGSRLVKYLSRKGYSVTEFKGDVRDIKAWNQYKHSHYNFLIHLAALAGVRPSFRDPEKYYDHNVNGTKLALEFGNIHADEILYASSSNAYEWWGNPYATTKKINEVQAMPYNAIGMRFHTIWPGRPDMLFQKFKRNEVTYINTGHYRDFININDLLSAIEVIMNNFRKLKSERSVYDIGTGHATPVEEVANIFNFNGIRQKENPDGERSFTKADIEYLLELGWTPSYNILIPDHHKDYE